MRTRKAVDDLSVALASGAFAKLVGYFTVRPDATPHLRALMRETGMGARSAQMELLRLEQLGLVAGSAAPDGRMHIRAVGRAPAWPAFRALVKAYGDPVELLRFALADLDGIGAAFIFGSIAKGTATAESDIDLFVMARSDDHDELRRVEELVARRATEAGLGLGREVSVVVRGRQQIAEKLAAGASFYERVLAGPKRWVIGDGLRIQHSAIK